MSRHRRPELGGLAGSMLADELRRRYGATAADGAPASAPDGLYLLAVTNAELRAVVELATTDAAAVRLHAIMPAERVALYEAGWRLVALHTSDLSVPNGYLPELDAPATADFGQVIAVVDGRAVGHLLLHDGRPAPGEPFAADYVPIFDTVANVWVAHRHRRRGIAGALLERARAEHPLVRLRRPFTPAGAAWAATCAPDLVDVGRNSPCPCGSGAKFKRCCAEARSSSTHRHASTPARRREGARHDHLPARERAARDRRGPPPGLQDPDRGVARDAGAPGRPP